MDHNVAGWSDFWAVLFCLTQMVDCDDALQTGARCVECLDETNMILKYF